MWLADAIQSAFIEGRGLAVGKLGTCELDTMYMYNKQQPYNCVHRLQMTRNAGLWPDSDKTLYDWAAYMAKHVLPYMDSLASWWNVQYEDTIFRTYAPHAYLQKDLEWFEPWRDGHMWTKAIPGGTKVAIVSPFVESIASQTSFLNNLFEEPLWNEPLPEIIPIQTGCSPLYDATSPCAWSSTIREGGWLIAVAHILKEVVASGARVAIVGCGALSLPIVVALKKRGIIAIHMGGATQLLFRIRGARWLKDPSFSAICNRPHWISPRPSETPLHAKTIEGGCYW